MINTSRISSGFDIELQLGGGWFFTALNLMNDNGLLAPPGIGIVISDVQISFEPGWDLQIDVLGFPDPVFAKVEISDDGSELILTTSLPDIPEKTIPFGALKDLADPPVLVKAFGDAEHEPVIAILANLNIIASSQSGEPEINDPDARILNPDNVQSFLPTGKDIVFGMGRDTYSRFANNIWHTELRASDGTHPLPDEENKKGDWHSVSMFGSNGKIILKLNGEVPIDIWPDAEVTITITITPKISAGILTFEIDSDSNVDTGILGDIFAGLTGGLAGALIGLIIGALTGGILFAVLLGAGIGFVVGIIALEIVEVVIEGKVQKIIKAKINGEDAGEIHCNESGIVQIAMPSGGGFNLSFLDSIPSSIAINTVFPEDEFLYKRSLLVTSVYDEFEANSNGFGVCGLSGTAEKYQPEIVSIKEVTYNGDDLVSLLYRRADGQEQELTFEEVIQRALDGEIIPGFKLFEKPEDADLRIPEGKLACVCLKPTAINQDDTVVKEIEFENGLKLKVRDAISLQDAGAIVVTGYQLIHPRDYKSYFRAKADFFLDNNFESLPKY